VGVRTRPPALTWSLGGGFVFVDQATEDGSALGSLRWHVDDRMVGLGWVEVERAVRASLVVVPSREYTN
jgi:hypothetical protein